MREDQKLMNGKSGDQNQNRGYSNSNYRDEDAVQRAKEREQEKKLLTVTERGDVDHLAKDFTEGSFVVFDLETTGGNPSRNGLTEIFALRFEKGEVVKTFYTMVNPRVRIPGIVRRMTGITNQMVREAPYIEHVMPGFVDFIGDSVLVSHNTIGDMKFLRYFSLQTTGKMIHNYYMCTHLLAEKLISESKDKSLKGLSEFLGHLDGHEIHRAEGDTYLTLALFKELLKRLNIQKIAIIIDAIRFQGDFESAMRLGWGVTKENLKSLPKGPGVFYLKDARGKMSFAASAASLNREVQKLTHVETLPRSLTKSILASCTIAFDECADSFAAAMKEVEIMEQEKLVCDPIEWHQRTAAFLFALADDQGGIRFVVGPLEPGAIMVLGPMRGSGSVHDYLDRMAECFGLNKSKKGLRVPLAEGEFLLKYLTGAREAFWTRIKQRLTLKRFKGKSFDQQKISLALDGVKKPDALTPLAELTGLLVIGGESAGRHVYVISNGCLVFGESLPGALADWVRDDANYDRVINGFKVQSSAQMDRPLSSKEVRQINRIAWWIFFGTKKLQGIQFVLAGRIAAMRAQ